MKKIAFMGAHSSAKTTTVNRMARVLSDMGYIVEVITEVARDCPIPINEEGSFDAQLWMIQEQARRETKAIGGPADRVFAILCDRCIWDYLAYSLSLHEMGKMTDTQLELIREIVKAWALVLNYDLIYFCEPKPLYDDGTRSTDEKWRDNIVMWFKRIIKTYGLKVNIVQ